MNLTTLFKKTCRIARKILFPDDGLLTIEGKRNDDTGAYAQVITITDFWYAKRARALEDTEGEQVYIDVMDFYIADGIGLTRNNFKSNERLTTNGLRFDIMTIQPTFSSPRFWRVRCRPTGEPV